MDTATDEADDDGDGFGVFRTLLKGGGAVLLGLVVELGISFVGKALIARELGRVKYGGVSLGITTAAIASTLILLGLRNGVGRYLPRDDDPGERRSVLVSAFRIAVPLSMLAGLGVFLAAPVLATEVFSDPGVAPVMRVFAVAIPFGAVMKLALGSVQGMQDSLPKVAIQNVTFPVTRFAGIVVALLVGAGSLGVSYAYLVSYVAAALAGLYYLWTRTPLFSFDTPYRGRERELLSFSLPLVVTGAMSIIISDIDMYMLGALRGTGVVGDYNVVYPLAQLLLVAISSFGFLFMPAVSELDADGAEDDRMKRLYQVVTKWVVVVTLPVFLVFLAFPRWTILYSFGGEYVGGATALSVLAVGFFLHTVFGLNKGALTSLGHTRLLMYDDIVAAAANIIINLALIPPFGLVGAAVATTASYAILNFLYSYQLYRRTGIHPFTRALVVPPVVGAAAMTVVYVFARAYVTVSPLSLGVLFVAFVLVYGLAVLRFGVEPEEVRLVLSFEERFGVDLGPLKRLANRLM
jgi:O-antigen/teichoic acid export membrane protein